MFSFTSLDVSIYSISDDAKTLRYLTEESFLMEETSSMDLPLTLLKLSSSWLVISAIVVVFKMLEIGDMEMVYPFSLREINGSDEFAVAESRVRPSDVEYILFLTLRISLLSISCHTPFESFLWTAVPYVTA